MLKEITLRNVEQDQTIYLAPRESYILDKIDWDVASVTQNKIYYYPFETTEDILANQWNMRNVSLSGWICANNQQAIETLSQRLNSFIGVQIPLQILYRGFYLDWVATESVKFLTDEKDDNEYFRKFEIKGIATDSKWYTEVSARITNSESQSLFYFPLFFNPNTPRVVFGKIVSDNSLTIEYTAEIPASPVITLNFIGSVSDISITLVNNQSLVQQKFSLSGTYTNGYITIDSRSDYQSVIFTSTDDGLETNLENDIVPGSSWFTLTKGTYTLTLNETSENQVQMEIDIKQSALYEVQML